MTGDFACSVCGLSDRGFANLISLKFRVRGCAHCADHFDPLLPTELAEEPAPAAVGSSSSHQLEEPTSNENTSAPPTLW